MLKWNSKPKLNSKPKWSSKQKWNSKQKVEFKAKSGIQAKKWNLKQKVDCMFSIKKIPLYQTDLNSLMIQLKPSKENQKVKQIWSYFNI